MAAGTLLSRDPRDQHKAIGIRDSEGEYWDLKKCCAVIFSEPENVTQTWVNKKLSQCVGFNHI